IQYIFLLMVLYCCENHKSKAFREKRNTHQGMIKNSEELRHMSVGPYGDPTASTVSTSTISTQPTLKHSTQHQENHSRGGGFVGTILNLIKIGTGYVILALPFAFYSFGLVFGLLFMGLVLLLNFVTLY